MGIAPSIVDWLRRRGDDAEHLEAQGLERLPDDQIFSKALAERRVLLTFDLDFAEIVALSGGAEVSVILFRLENTRTNFVRARLEAVLRDSAHLLGRGVIVAVNDSRHRVRRLPIQRGEPEGA